MSSREQLVAQLMLALASVVGTSCRKENSPDPAPGPVVPAPEVVTDIDGNAYSTVIIGGRVWMAENLRVIRFRNGDAIAHRPDQGEWTVPNGNAWCVYGNDAGNKPTHGLLYGYQAVVDPRGLCPTGWHVPTDGEWAQLELALGMPVSEIDSLSPSGFGAWRGEVANVGGQLKATTTWEDPNTGATNTSGFAVKASGQRAMPGAGYQGLGTLAAFWTSTSSGFFEGWVRMLRFDRPGIMRLHHHMGSDQPGYGHSCRCIKDD